MPGDRGPAARRCIRRAPDDLAAVADRGTVAFEEDAVALVAERRPGRG